MAQEKNTQAKVIAGIGGVTAGAIAATALVDSHLRKNIESALYDKPQSVVEAALAEVNGPGQKTAARHALEDNKTVLGKAFEKASQTERGQAINTGLTAEKIIAIRHDALLKQTSPALRAESAELQMTELALKKGSEALEEPLKLGRKVLASDVTEQLPWLDKMLMKDISLTKQQKTEAGIVFGAVTAVAAGAIYALTKHQHKQLAQPAAEQQR